MADVKTKKYHFGDFEFNISISTQDGANQLTVTTYYPGDGKESPCAIEAMKLIKAVLTSEELNVVYRHGATQLYKGEKKHFTKTNETIAGAPAPKMYDLLDRTFSEMEKTFRLTWGGNSTYAAKSNYESFAQCVADTMPPPPAVGPDLSLREEIFRDVQTAILSFNTKAPDGLLSLRVCDILADHYSHQFPCLTAGIEEVILKTSNLNETDANNIHRLCTYLAERINKHRTEMVESATVAALDKFNHDSFIKLAPDKISKIGQKIAVLHTLDKTAIAGILHASDAGNQCKTIIDTYLANEVLDTIDAKLYPKRSSDRLR